MVSVVYEYVDIYFCLDLVWCVAIHVRVAGLANVRRGHLTCGSSAHITRVAARGQAQLWENRCGMQSTPQLY